MSFSNDVREEIARSITDRDRQFACLYGILLYSRIFTQEQVVLQSESPVFARLMPMLFRAVFRTELQPDVRTISRGGDQSMVSYTITDAAQISRICESITFVRKSGRSVFQSGEQQPECFSGRRIFGCGSMIDPNKEYHLEFNTPSELLCSDLQKLLGSIGISGGQLLRKNMYVLYLKDSEHIEDTLTYMGAQQCTIALMNIKIRKDMRNKANRVRNCDEANINKVVGAAIRQIQDIQWITQCEAAGGTFSGTTGTGRDCGWKIRNLV
ncbi:MAG: DNA-binding protein WhiA [Ruminococcus callidus]